MSRLCDNTVAGPTARRDDDLASTCEHPPFWYPPSQHARRSLDNGNVIILVGIRPRKKYLAPPPFHKIPSRHPPGPLPPPPLLGDPLGFSIKTDPFLAPRNHASPPRAEK